MKKERKLGTELGGPNTLSADNKRGPMLAPVELQVNIEDMMSQDPVVQFSSNFTEGCVHEDMIGHAWIRQQVGPQR